MAKQNTKPRHAINPTRSENFPEWYQQIIQAADLAEHSPVRGCMVIKPWGFGIWENIQKQLDKMFKATGHVNAYFPLLIPLSFLEKEAKHIEGFAKECAVVTHHRLEDDGEGGLKPAGQLEEPLIIRPTSEAIIGTQFSKWIQSYRDLPLLINQWANVMRWEMRTRLFLRTSEFLWQEGHTAHTTAKEAQEETLRMLNVYYDFAHQYLALPVIKGEKTPEERFPGALNTYTIEGIMQDGKALQAGTSHFLGQNFSKSFDITFNDAQGDLQYAWTTSWGVSTRLIGALIMTHSDDDGLIVPPRIAQTHVQIIPVVRKKEEEEAIFAFCEDYAKQLRTQQFHGEPVSVYIDKRDKNGGEKTWDAIKKGVPIRLEIGPRDIANHSVFMGRRDLPPHEKMTLSQDDFVSSVAKILEDIQQNLYIRARHFLADNTHSFTKLDDFKHYFKDDNSGFVEVFCAEEAHYDDIVSPLKVSARCIPLDRSSQQEGFCIFTGTKTTRRVIFAKSY